jgi:hypothetical protein
MPDMLPAVDTTPDEWGPDHDAEAVNDSEALDGNLDGLHIWVHDDNDNGVT